MIQTTLLSRLRKVIDHPAYNFVWFYMIWLALVIGGNEWIWLALVLISIHYLIIEDKVGELLLATSVAAIGVIVDSALSIAGIFLFEYDQIIPAWLVVLWIAFASILRRGLAFLIDYPLITIFLGGLGGASSYFSGYLLDAVEFGYRVELTLVILFIHWSILLPAFLFIAVRTTRGRST